MSLPSAVTRSCTASPSERAVTVAETETYMKGRSHQNARQQTRWREYTRVTANHHGTCAIALWAPHLRRAAGKRRAVGSAYDRSG